MVEVRRGLEFYKTKTLSAVPKEVLLNGDGSLLPGLPEFVTKSLGINSTVANPWQGIEVPSKYSDLVVKSGSSFSVAIGLALKDE